ncbi:MAG: long-chain fatty acid--CoA ligase [Alicyclobacillus sp.]|nr:long-chain fatty acid--CoA ligase [Alicyclobacillus sp.]
MRKASADAWDNLVQMLAETAVERAGDRALMFPNPVNGWDSVTYDQLWRQVERAAAHLADVAVGAGDKVGLLAEGGWWWPVCDFAIMSLGACTVPIYPSLPPGQMQYIIRDSGMKGLCLQDAAQLEKLLQVEPSDIPSLEFVVLLDDNPNAAPPTTAGPWPVYRLSQWLHRQPLHARPQGWWQAVSKDALATIVYTSGTTGQPKGVMLTHGNLLANVGAILRQFAVEPHDLSLSYLPLSHIFERTVGQFCFIAAGGTICFSHGIHAIMDDFLQVRPTLFTTVPRLLEKVYEGVTAAVEAGPPMRRRLFEWAMTTATRARVRREPASGWALQAADRLVLSQVRNRLGGRLRCIISGGAPLPPYVAEFLTAVGVPVVEGYGMTETSPVVCFNPLHDIRIGTVGKRVDNVEIRIAEDGEILVRGPSITAGYYQNAEATQELFTADGWMHTGDIGELRPDDYLVVTDRKKNLIVLSTGKKVTPAPIEEEILRNRYVDQVLLLGQGRKFIAALVVPNVEEVRAWYRREGVQPPLLHQWAEDAHLNGFLLAQVRRQTEAFAEFERPKRVLVVSEPMTIENGLLTPTLKVKAKAVQAAYAAEIDRLYAEAAHPDAG